jgi:hypothetical protein
MKERLSASGSADKQNRRLSGAMTPAEREKFKQECEAAASTPERADASRGSRGKGMSYISFTKTALAAAVAKGVRQCVAIASRPQLRDALSTSSNPTLRVFAVDEDVVSDSSATFVPTRFADETLAAALEKSDFDRLKASLFVWLGGAGYRAVESLLSSLAFIGSLPKGSGVVLDYAAKHLSLGPPTETALDALASRMSSSGGNFKHIIQPQAVGAMLHGFGFRQIVDLAEQEVPVSEGHLVSAVA